MRVEWLLAVMVAAGCKGNEGPSPAPSASTMQAPWGAPAPKRSTCRPWPLGPFSLAARTSGPHGADSRELDFDDASGTVTLNDATGTKALPDSDHAALRRNLLAICPDAAALALACAPGGCSELEVTWPGGKTKVQDHVTVARVMGLLEAFFPELHRESAVDPSGSYDVLLAADGSGAIGTMRLSPTAELTVTSVSPDRAVWLGDVADRTNHKVTLGSPPLQRIEPAFAAALHDELRRAYGIELRKR